MKGKNRTAVIAVILAALLAAGILAGTYLYSNRFDAADYVQAVVDASYKNETELYVEITGVSEEEAQEIFEENLDATMEGFESSDMPQDMQPKYRELFGELAKNISCTAGEPKEQEDGSYIVPVTVKPVTVFTDTYATFQARAQEYAQQVTDQVMDGGEMPEDARMQAEIYGIYYEVLKERTDSGMLYGGARNVDVHVTKESSRNFSIDEGDMDRLDSMLIESVHTEPEE